MDFAIESGMLKPPAPKLGRAVAAAHKSLAEIVRTPGAAFAKTTNHYGLLRTIEDGWGLPYLGRSATARPIAGIWKLPVRG